MPVDPRLAQYVQAELGKGFSKEQIRLALTNSGYQARDVDAVFASFASDKAGAASLAQSFARNGTPAEETHAQLVQAGYTGTAAASATRSVYGVAPSGSKTIVFAVLAMVIGAGGMWLLVDDAEPAVPIGPMDGPYSFSPAEIIASVLETARSQGADAGVAACRERLSGRDRDLCILDVAILPNVGAVSLCDQVSDVAYADACYLNYIGNGGNIDALCAKIRLAENRDTCETIKLLGGSANAA